MAATNFNVLRNWLYLDAAAYGSYHPIALAYLREKGIMPTVEDGDRDVMKVAKPDFLAFNYYTSETVCAPLGDGTDRGPVGGDAALVTGEEGVYRGATNPYLRSREFGWEIDPVGFRNTLRAIYDRYRRPLLLTKVPPSGTASST